MDLARIEGHLVVASEPSGVAAYDFDFGLHFRCDHPYVFEYEEHCVLRVGAVPDYAARHAEFRALNLQLVNSPAEHSLASELEHWYPLIPDLTPHSEVFESLPDASEVETKFGWPVFLKGSRQTSRHSADLAVIESPDHYRLARERFGQNSILRWQKPVLRRFVPLAPVAGTLPGKIRPSLEFRSFWWYGTCVGWGRYWYQVPPYGCPDAAEGLEVARRVSERLKVPFLVVDVAKTAGGAWIVIECNDAQEAGYAGVAPRRLWDAVLALSGDGQGCP